MTSSFGERSRSFFGGCERCPRRVSRGSEAIWLNDPSSYSTSTEDDDDDDDLSASSMFIRQVDDDDASARRLQILIQEYHQELERLITKKLSSEEMQSRRNLIKDEDKLDRLAEIITNESHCRALKCLIEKILYTLSHDMQHFHSILNYLTYEEGILKIEEVEIIERCIKYCGVRTTLEYIEKDELFNPRLNWLLR